MNIETNTPDLVRYFCPSCHKYADEHEPCHGGKLQRCHVWRMEGGGTFETWPHKASGAELASRTLLPDVLDFRELFPGFAWHGSGEAFGPRTHSYEQASTIGPHISFRGEGAAYDYGTCRPSDAVVMEVSSSMMTGCGPISFEVVAHDDWSLVVARYGRIIGQRFVAYVRTETVPKREGGGR